MTSEAAHAARAAVAIDDELAIRTLRTDRLREIEQALKFDDDPERRLRLKRQFLDLTDPERKAA